MPDDLGFPVVTRIGTNLGNLEDTKVAPVVQFTPAPQTRRTVCGAQVAAAPQAVAWTYPGRKLKGDQFHQLKKFVGDNMSAPVVIETPTENVSTTTYLPIIATYNAVMNWPSEGVELVPINQWELPDDGIVFTQLTPAT